MIHSIDIGIELTLDTVEVEYEYYPGCPARFDSYGEMLDPAEGSSVEISAVRLYHTSKSDPRRIGRESVDILPCLDRDQLEYIQAEVLMALE